MKTTAATLAGPAPDSSQLTQRLWVWRGEADKPAIATLELNANSSQENDWGSGTFIWWYESDYTTPEEVYEGDWSLSANRGILRRADTGYDPHRRQETQARRDGSAYP